MVTNHFTCVLMGKTKNKINPLLTHFNFHRDEDEAATLLINKGAQVNAKNKGGATPINIAAIKGNVSALKVFVSHPDIDLSNQVTSYTMGQVFIILSPIGW